MATVAGGGGTPKKNIAAAQQQVKADRYARGEKAYNNAMTVRSNRAANPVAKRAASGTGPTSGPGAPGKVYVQKPHPITGSPAHAPAHHGSAGPMPKGPRGGGGGGGGGGQLGRGAPKQPAYNPLPASEKRTGIDLRGPKFNPSATLNAGQITDKRGQKSSRKLPPPRTLMPAQVVSDIPWAVQKGLEMAGDAALFGQNTEKNKLARLRPKTPAKPTPGPAPTSRKR